MKKAIKLCLALAGTLFALGLVLHLAGIALGGRRESVQYYENRWKDIAKSDWGHIWVNSDGVHIGGENGIHVDSDGISIGGEHGIYAGHHNEADYSGKNQLVESGELSGITAIEVDVDCGNLWIQEGESFSVSLSWNLSNYVMRYTVENGTLKVEDESWGMVKSEDHFNVDCKMILTVPAEATIDTLDLSTDMGDIQVDAAITAREAELSTNLGNVVCRGLLAREMEAQSDLGDVTVTVSSECKGLSYSLSADLGEVFLNGQAKPNPTLVVEPEEEYYLEAKSSLGDVSLQLP